MDATPTIVIPTLDEAERLPRLLDLLAAQTMPPDPVVVGDAESTDATVEIACARGANVVAGGKPAAGRNAGAAVATTDLIFFLHADDEPDPRLIERAGNGLALKLASGPSRRLRRFPVPSAAPILLLGASRTPVPSVAVGVQ